MADRVLAEPVVRPPRAPVEPDPSKDGDIYARAMRPAALLREGPFNEVDIVNVADEIEDVGRSEQRTLGSNLEQLLCHILEWTHQPERRGRSWALAINEHRDRILHLLDENPILAGKHAHVLAKSYRIARTMAARETDLPLKRFPSVCPYTWAQIMETPYELENG